MADDWRVTITVADASTARHVVASLHDHDAAGELQDEIGGRVAVSAEGPHVFLYASTRTAAAAAERTVRELLGDDAANAELRLDRWHPHEERWEDADVPLPETEEQREAEQARLDALDEATSVETGVAQWEVRLELASPRDAESLAAELERDGRSVVRRSEFLIVGANSQGDAEEVAARVGDRARVHVEPSTGVAWQFLETNPFAVFGGLAG